MRDLFAAAESRRSIRTFADTPVDVESVDALLEAARRAPSAVNLQPTRVLVVTEPADLAVVRSAAYGVGACASAPCVLVCMADLTADSHLGERVGELVESRALEPLDMSTLTSGAGRPFQLKIGRDVALLNCAIAVAHMDLEAASLGLGACWVHHADFDMIREHFDIPETVEIVTLLPVGHPAEQPGSRPRIDSVRWEPGE
jgi:nitroreductase